MKPIKPANLAASISRRLLNISRERNADYELVLNQYAVERLLYRISKSKHANQFILKGAALFTLWTGRPHRPTRDVDLLGYGESSKSRLRAVFQELCEVQVEEDGLVLDASSVSVSDIRENQAYHGQRIKLLALLGKSRIMLQVDVGFGDVVEPAPIEVKYPALLDLPSPTLRAYSRESVVAEKLQSMVALDVLNSRMKDFYDIWTISRKFAFDGLTLISAIRATFQRRKTLVPLSAPIALTSEFAALPDKDKQWMGFLRGVERKDLHLGLVIEELRGFLLPPLLAAGKVERFDRVWPAGGPWQNRDLR